MPNNNTPDLGVNNLVDLQANRDELIVTVADDSVHDTGFSQVPNDIIRHESLSPEASFLLIYLLSHKAGFNINDTLLTKRMGCCQRKLEKLFSQLFDAGYTTLVYDRNKRGHIIGSRRVFSRLPKYLEINAQTRLKRRRLKLVTETSNNRVSVEPSLGKRQDNKNTSFVKNTISVNNNNSIPAKEPASMPIVDSEKVNKLHRQLNDSRTTVEMMESWITWRGEEFIAAWLDDFDKREEKVDNRGGYLRSVVTKGHLPTKRKQKASDPYAPEVRHKTPEETKAELGKETTEEERARSKAKFDELRGKMRQLVKVNKT